MESVQELVGPEHIASREHDGIRYAVVNMGITGEVDNRIKPKLGQPDTHIPLLEVAHPHARVRHDVGEVAEPGSITKAVHDMHGIVLAQMGRNVAPDEASPACY